MAEGVATCSTSLLDPGQCCRAECVEPAVFAVLDPDPWPMVEHTECAGHAESVDEGLRKPLQWHPLWAPP